MNEDDGDDGNNKRDGENETLRLTFDEWSRLTNIKRLSEYKRRQAVRFRYFKLLKNGFDGFRNHVDEVKKRIEMLCQIVQKRIKAKLFYQWIQIIQQEKQRTREIEYNRIQILESFVDRWKLHINQVRQSNRDIQTANHHYDDTITCKSFKLWIKYCEYRRALYISVETTVKSRQDQRNKRTIHSCFQVWKSYMRNAAIKRNLTFRAHEHWHSTLIQRVFDRWVQFVGMQRWDEILYLRAAKHCAHMVQQHAFIAWKKRACSLKHERGHTTMALLHWKATVQKRALNAWIQWMQKKRAKRVWRHDALEWRHRMFLRQGLSHWAHAAFVLQEQKMQKTTRQAAFEAERLWRRVGRIAMHWRFVAANHLIQGHRKVSIRAPISSFRNPQQYTSDLLELQPLGMSSVVVATRRLPPRKPVDLLLDNDQSIHASTNVTSVNVSSYQPRHGEVEKYGIQVPVRPHIPKHDKEDLESVVAEMEKRIQFWREKKEAWNQHKKQLDELKHHLTDTSIPEITREMLHRTLIVMEGSHRDNMASYAASKAEMTAFAQQIKELRRRSLPN